LDVDSTSISGMWLRQIPSGGEVHYEPTDPAHNRWQRGTVIEGLYFGDDAATVWAEWYRYLAEAGLPPEQGLPRDLWRWEISLPEVADLSGDDRLSRTTADPHRASARRADGDAYLSATGGRVAPQRDAVDRRPGYPPAMAWRISLGIMNRTFSWTTSNSDTSAVPRSRKKPTSR